MLTPLDSNSSESAAFLCPSVSVKYFHRRCNCSAHHLTNYNEIIRSRLPNVRYRKHTPLETKQKRIARLLYLLCTSHFYDTLSACTVLISTKRIPAGYRYCAWKLVGDQRKFRFGKWTYPYTSPHPWKVVICSRRFCIDDRPPPHACLFLTIFQFFEVIRIDTWQM